MSGQHNGHASGYQQSQSHQHSSSTQQAANLHVQSHYSQQQGTHTTDYPQRLDVEYDISPERGSFRGQVPADDTYQLRARSRQDTTAFVAQRQHELGGIRHTSYTQPQYAQENRKRQAQDTISQFNAIYGHQQTAAHTPQHLAAATEAERRVYEGLGYLSLDDTRARRF